MGKRFRMYTKIRTDSMELKIAWAIFESDYRGEEMLRELCEQFGIPIRKDEIEKSVADYKRFDNS